MSLLTGARRALLRQQKVWSVQFYQENDGINFASGGNIDDLFTGDCTIEFWMRAQVPASTNYLLSKTDGTLNIGWFVSMRADGFIELRANFAVTDTIRFTNRVLDNRRHHIAWDWDFGTLTSRLFVDGVIDPTGSVPTAVGAYQADAAQDALVNAYNAIGTGDGAFAIGPIRLSNSRRYTDASFNPPTMNHWPENDANAQLVTRMNDGSGVTATDYSGNGYNGTITFGANTRWYHGPA